MAKTTTKENAGAMTAIATPQLSQPQNPINLDALNVNQIDNSVNPSSKTEYIAWTNFTSLKMKDGRLANHQYLDGDIVTPAMTPQQWIDIAVAQRFLILKEDKMKLTERELALLGYAKKSRR